MAQNIYYKKGGVLEYRLQASEIFKNGDLVVKGHYVGVCTANASAGDLVALQINGIWDLPYKDNDTVNIGDALYYDESSKKLTKTAGSNVFVGLAQAPVVAGEKTVRTHLKGIGL